MEQLGTWNNDGRQWLRPLTKDRIPLILWLKYELSRPLGSPIFSQLNQIIEFSHFYTAGRTALNIKFEIVFPQEGTEHSSVTAKSQGWKIHPDIRVSPWWEASQQESLRHAKINGCKIDECSRLYSRIITLTTFRKAFIHLFSTASPTTPFPSYKMECSDCSRHVRIQWPCEYHQGSFHPKIYLFCQWSLQTKSLINFSQFLTKMYGFRSQIEHFLF